MTEPEPAPSGRTTTAALPGAGAPSEGREVLSVLGDRGREDVGDRAGGVGDRDVGESLEVTALPHLCECGCGQPTTLSVRDTPSGAVEGQPNRFVRGHNRRKNRATADGRVVCARCERALPPRSFHRSSGSPTGLQLRCKDCSREMRNQWARDNREHARAREREWLASKPGYAAAKHQEQKAKFPEKVAARKKLAQAVRRGHVVKPSTCSACGREFERRLIHGHHQDYARPLEVTWLCAACHAQQHPSREAS